MHLYLRPKELAWRILIRVVTRHLNEPINIILCHRFSNPFRALNVDIPQTEILRRIIFPNQIVHDITMPHTLLNTLRVPQIKLQESDPTKITGDFEVPLGHIVAVGDYHLAPAAGEALHDVPAQETIGAEDCGGVATEGGAAAGGGNYGFAGAGYCYVGNGCEGAALGVRSEGDVSGMAEDGGGRLAGLHCGMQRPGGGRYGRE
jgi:hypothetical protein